MARSSTLERWKIHQAVGELSDRNNRSRWGHDKPGRIVHWESLMARIMGDGWRSMAADRLYWRHSRLHFVHAACTALVGANHRAFGVKNASKPEWTPTERARPEPIQQMSLSISMSPMSNMYFQGRAHDRTRAKAILRVMRRGLVTQIVGDS